MTALPMLDPDIRAAARRRGHRRRAVVAAAAALAVAGGGSIAYSYWTSPTTTPNAGTLGLGTGTVTVALTTASSLLIGTSQSVTGTLTNTGTTPVHVTQVVFSVASIKDSGGLPLLPASCDPSWFALTAATVNADIPAGGSIPLTSGMGGSFVLTNLAGTNQDLCKLATVTLGATVS